MKYLIPLICLMLTNSALAHEDHALGESVHLIYHFAFWGLSALVAYKGFVWFLTQKRSKKKSTAND